MNPSFVLPVALALFAAALPAIADDSPPPAPKEVPAKPSAPSVKPELYAKALLGSWRHEMKQGEADGYSVTTYLEGGKSTSIAHIVAGDKQLNITAKAKWTLEKDKLTSEITEFSMPELLPPGTKITQTIISLSETEFRYLQDGKEVTERRVKLIKPSPTPPAPAPAPPPAK
ncbi:hypothetical protein [Luteolibacter soli]|uniref:Lipocalin-like domain-containing protein n=1 Tax=Luteolibacter soli TaxID=3135280 RepID=A0ABU9B203_9BACT